MTKAYLGQDLGCHGARARQDLPEALRPHVGTVHRGSEKHETVLVKVCNPGPVHLLDTG